MSPELPRGVWGRCEQTDQHGIDSLIRLPLACIILWQGRRRPPKPTQGNTPLASLELSSTPFKVLNTLSTRTHATWIHAMSPHQSRLPEKLRYLSENDLFLWRDRYFIWKIFYSEPRIQLLLTEVWNLYNGWLRFCTSKVHMRLWF